MKRRDRVTNRKENFLLTLLLAFMMVDYYLTYIGIHVIGYISEGNSLMVWLMDLPLWQGVIIRSLWVGGFIYLLEHHKDTTRDNVIRNSLLRGPDEYSGLLKVANLLNSFIFLMHVNWLTEAISLGRVVW